MARHFTLRFPLMMACLIRGSLARVQRVVPPQSILPLWIGLVSLLVFGLSPSSISAQSNQDAPVQFLQSDVGLAVEWRIDAPADGALDSIEELIDAGWTSQLYLDLSLPSYRFITAELADAEISSAEEIVSFVEITQREAWDTPIEVQPLPTAMGPTGEELPFISPLDAPASSIPEEPVFVLREGIQRGSKRFVIAISPIYQVDGQVMVATRGTAWLIGVEQFQESDIGLSLPSLSLEDLLGSDTSSDTDTGSIWSDPPRATPTATEASAVDSQLAPSQALPETSNLQSPLPTPTPQALIPAPESPLDTPAPTPVTTTAAPVTEDGTNQSQEDAVDQRDADEQGAFAATALPVESSIPSPAADTRSVLPVVQVPWSGIIFFSMLGVALILLLFRGNE